MGKNLGAADAAGFNPISGESFIEDMMTDGENCYVIDFGADLGPPSDDSYPGKLLRDGVEFCDEEEHRELVREGYHSVWENL